MTKPVEEMDVFEAAAWLDDLWNSTARAVSATEIEWQCRTWGSGRGRCAWTDVALFLVVAEVFGLRSGRNFDGRDETIVWVPFETFPRVAKLIDRLTETDEPESWPWFDDEVEDRQVAVAAEVLGISEAELVANDRLLEALRIV